MLRRADGLALLFWSTLVFGQNCPPRMTWVRTSYGGYCAASPTLEQRQQPNPCPDGQTRIPTSYGSYCGEAPFFESDPCKVPASFRTSAKAWKHGDSEQQDFIRASTTKDPKTRTQLLGDFSTRYPDSDYRDTALLLRLGAEDELGSWDDLASDSRKLLRSPAVENVPLLLAGYTYLAEARFHIKADEATVQGKVSEVDWTVKCGREALDPMKKSQGDTDKSQAVAFSAEFTFAMAHAQAFDTLWD